MSWPRGPMSPERKAELAAKSRARWADPEYRARVSAAIAEGTAAACTFRRTRAHASGTKKARFADKRSMVFYADTDTFNAVRSVAVKEGKSLSEIIRTYVAWGLEAEGIDV